MAKIKPKRTLTPAQSFFIILIFVLGGFTTIMLNILLAESSSEDIDLNNSNLSDVEDIAKDVVLSSNLFNEFGSGLLVHEGVRVGECGNCFIFSFKFDVRADVDLPLNVKGFRYDVTMMGDSLKLVEVFELF
ncbi:MAG: hypothetical protein ACLFN8_02045 [Candidatus Woesearchaeota archaeon]